MSAADTQSRQLAEQLCFVKSDKTQVFVWLEWPKCGYEVFGPYTGPTAEKVCESLRHILTAFASHTRREALREAEEVVMDKANASLHENLPPTRECGICKGLRIGAAAIRLLAEEKNDVEA